MKTTTLATSLLAALALLVPACDAGPAAEPGGTDTSASTGDDGDPELLIGLGEEAFVASADGDEALVYFGPQGGTHMFTSLRVKGIDPGNPALARSNPANPIVSYLVEDLTLDATIGEAALRFPFADAGDGWYELVGLTLFLDRKTCEETIGHDVRVTVTVTDTHDVALEQTIDWLAIEDLETCPDAHATGDEREVREDD